MIVYRISHPLTEMTLYIGVANDLSKIKKQLYWPSNPEIQTALIALKAAGHNPEFTVLEEADEAIIDKRKLYWIQFHKSIGHDPLNRDVYPYVKRKAGRRPAHIQPTTCTEKKIDITFPHSLLDNKLFRERIEYKEQRLKGLSAYVLALIWQDINLAPPEADSWESFINT